VDENSEKVTFSTEIDTPVKTGERFLAADFRGIDSVESKITIVKKSKK